MLKMCALVLSNETLKKEPQYAFDVGSLACLFILHCTDLRVHTRIRETQAANYFSDVVASWPDSRLMIAIGTRPIIRSGGEARKVTRDLQIVTARTNHESALATQVSHKQSQLKQRIITWAKGLNVSARGQVIGSEHNGRKVEPWESIDEAVDECITNRKESFVPQCYLGVLCKQCPHRAGKLQSFGRRADEDCHLGHRTLPTWNHGPWPDSEHGSAIRLSRLDPG